jgi:hypothetical protein
MAARKLMQIAGDAWIPLTVALAIVGVLLFKSVENKLVERDPEMSAGAWLVDW